MNSVATLLYLPFFGAAVAMIGRRLVPQRYGDAVSVASITPLLGMAAILIGIAPAVFDGAVPTHILGGWLAPVAIGVRLDGFAWLSMALIVVITGSAAVATFSIRDAAAEVGTDAPRTYGPRFFFFLMTLVAGMGTVVLTTDVFTMFVGFEIIAIAAYVLIAYDRTNYGLVASFKYLLLSSVGILFFLIGVLVVYREFGTLSLIAVEDAIAGGMKPGPAVPTAVVALIVGIGVRTAFIPFHTWLPEAHAYAPHPVSAILSGVLIKVSFFALVRIVAVFDAAYLMPLFMWIGGITAVAAVVWALAQHDAKRLLAYHSISQMGYVLAAFGAASAISVPAALFHATNHAFFKTLLFLVVGTVIHGAGQRNLFRIPPVGRRAPVVALLFVVGAVSIAGVPPFNGFAGKQVVDAAVNAGAVEVPTTGAAIGSSAGDIGAAAGEPVPGIGGTTAAGARGNDAAALAVAARRVAALRTAARVVFVERAGNTASRNIVATLLSLAAVGTVASFLKLGRIALPGPPSSTATEPADLPPLPRHQEQPASLVVPAVLLAILCLVTGLAGRQTVTAIAAIITAGGYAAGDATKVLPPSLFTGSKLTESAITIVLGILVFRLVITRRGQRLAHVLQSLTPDIRGVLIMFVVGLGFFLGVALV